MLVLLGIPSVEGGGAEKQMLLHFAILSDIYDVDVVTNVKHALRSNLYTLPVLSLYSPFFLIKKFYLSSSTSKELLLVSYNLTFDIHFAFLRLFFILFPRVRVKHIVFERSSPRHQGVTLFKRLLRRLSIKFCSKILTNSRHAEIYYIQKYPQKKVCFIPNILALPSPCLKSNQIVSRTSSTLRFFSASRLIPSKQHDLAISFLEKLASLRPNLSVGFRIFGSGHLHPQLIRYKPRYMSSYLVSPWSDLDLVSLPKDYVFISLSAYEGCPNSVIEALAHGFHAVLSLIPAHQEVQSTNVSLIRLSDILSQSTIDSVLHDLSSTPSPSSATLISDFYSFKRIRPLLLSAFTNV
jgi:glycosyltransferase involved in cell wall biosynthesis